MCNVLLLRQNTNLILWDDMSVVHWMSNYDYNNSPRRSKLIFDRQSEIIPVVTTIMNGISLSIDTKGN